MTFKIDDTIQAAVADLPYYDVGHTGRVLAVHTAIVPTMYDVDFSGVPGQPVYAGGKWFVSEEHAVPAGTLQHAYTVILLRPDYTASNYGQDTYMTHVRAENPAAALAKARAEVQDADDTEENNPTDYFCIALLAGEHHDINPEL